MVPLFFRVFLTHWGQDKWLTFSGRYFKCTFLNESVWVSIKISLEIVPKGSINNIPALVQRMAWRRSGDNSLSDPMMVSILTHSFVTQSQWVNYQNTRYLLKVTFVIDKCRHSLAEGTPINYECDLKKNTFEDGNFSKGILTNEAIVTLTSGEYINTIAFCYSYHKYQIFVSKVSNYRPVVLINQHWLW